MCAGTRKGQIGQRWKLLTNIEKYGQSWTIMDKGRKLWTNTEKDRTWTVFFLVPGSRETFMHELHLKTLKNI